MKKLVVVGNGMAGVACVEQILKYRQDLEITIFGDETHVNYNRILLSCVLAGEKSAEDIVINDIDWYRKNGICARLGVRVEHIDRARRVAIDDQGQETTFDRLILATGSAAFIPPIPGVDKKNVHVFRTLDDTRDLIAKARKGCKAVVIGGGLLGLEERQNCQPLSGRRYHAIRIQEAVSPRKHS
jgi:nitrite reductase (NADH) large subunit